MLEDKTQFEQLKLTMELCESKEELDSLVEDIKSMQPEEQKKLRVVYADTLKQLGGK